MVAASLAFLVEAADDVCYSIIDLEDGCRLGLVSFEETVELLAPILKDKLDRKKLSNDQSLNKKLGTLRALVIGELIAPAPLSSLTMKTILSTENLTRRSLIFVSSVTR
ncbi:MAG: hypothetical protein WDN75_15610 [Bacteroidota bacterium]